MTSQSEAQDATLEIERQARIMELAQQQQMALQRLDEVVQNQRNLRETIVRSNNHHPELQEGEDQEPRDEEGEEEDDLLEEERHHQQQQQQAEEEEEDQPLLDVPSRSDHARHRHRHRMMERHDGGGRGSCSITQIYFVVSATLAFLAVVTSPSNVLFSTIRVTVKEPSSQKNNRAVEAMAASSKVKDKSVLQDSLLNLDIRGGASSVDSYGNIVDRVWKKGGGEWEAVVAHSKKLKQSPSASLKGSSKKRGGKSQSSSSSPESWTDTWNSFMSELRENFNQQNLVLELFNYQLALPIFPPGILEKDAAVAAAAAAAAEKENVKQASRWMTPWEWVKQQRQRSNANESPNKADDVAKPSNDENDDKSPKSDHNYRRLVDVSHIQIHSLLSPMLDVIYPSLIHPFLSFKKESDDTATTDTITISAILQGNKNNPMQEAETKNHSTTTSLTLAGIIDKIFTSTPRLIAIANLLLAVTYLLQTAVADVFLGPVQTPPSATTNHINNPAAVPTTATRLNALDDQVRHRRRRAGRERFGGFLLFKLLLTSAVLEPDSLDLFILLSWYTFLSFLRSLSHLAGTTANHASQSGESPSLGALRLLVLVLVCDASATAGCVAVFYSTGWNMLFLLTCDCILLGIDAIAHIFRFVVAAMEEKYRVEVSVMEERQLELHELTHEAGLRDSRNDVDVDSGDGDDGELRMDDDRNNIVETIRRERSGLEEFEDDGELEGPVEEDNDIALETELRQLDQDVAIAEAEHARCMGAMDTAIFALEIYALLVTIAHFVHIWALHGTSFGLVDGVLALHLHSTISMIGKKIAERRNVHRISRELNSNFPDANDLDIRKASAAGDVCCICLNSMMVGGVKKVGCGHMFHTNCLREVVERERSIATAKCPLCRASLVTGRQEPPPVVRQPMAGGLANNGNNETTNTNNNDGALGRIGADVGPAQPANPQQIPVEESLLRFSTENILPAWLPVPAFAFEIVRRDTTVVEPNPNSEGGWQGFVRRGGEDANNDDDNGQENNEQPPPEEGENEPSFWRRLLILLGAIPMSPEEEAMALEQLVDMFPQYDRADLLRELRARRSAEAVAESILLGIFSGIPRGGGVDVD